MVLRVTVYGKELLGTKKRCILIQICVMLIKLGILIVLIITYMIVTTSNILISSLWCRGKARRRVPPAPPGNPPGRFPGGAGSSPAALKFLYVF